MPMYLITSRFFRDVVESS